MRLTSSRYNYYLNMENGRVLIWNTLSGELLPADAGVGDALREGRAAELPGSVLSALADAGMAVPPERDELSLLEEEARRKAAGEEMETGGFFRVFTTTECNAACPYCYESHRENLAMSDAAAHETAEFMARHAVGNVISAEWFGGEPLLNSRAISLICRDLKMAGIHYFSRVTTNGSLWTEALLREAEEEWNLQSVQITLDGTGEAHDAAKHLPPGSFYRIIDAVHALADRGIAVRIRINHGEGQDHRALAGFLAGEFAAEPHVSAYVTPAYRAGAEYPEPLMKEILRLNLMLKDAGLAFRGGRYLPRRIHSGCYVCNPYNYTISADGRLYSCAHNLSPEQCVGDVRRGAVPPEGQTFLRRTFSKKCRSCVLLPVCMGGCRAAELKTAPMTQCPPVKGMLPELVRYEAVERGLLTGPSEGL